MADLVITANNVVKGSGATVENGTAGATLTAGQLVYKDTADSDKFKLSDANGAAATQRIDGVALNGAAAGQPVQVLLSGALNPGATVTVGTIYVLSATAGGICPAADLASGHKACILGVGTTASNIQVAINNSGASVP